MKIENRKYRDPEVLFPYLMEKIADNEMYYVLLDEVHMYPLTYSEFMSVYDGDKQEGWRDYLLIYIYTNEDDVVAKLIFLNGEMRESAWYSEMEFLCPLHESDLHVEFHVSQKLGGLHESEMQ